MLIVGIITILAYTKFTCFAQFGSKENAINCSAFI